MQTGTAKAFGQGTANQQAQAKFSIGDRVKLSPTGRECGMWYRDPERGGVVNGYSQDGLACVWVLRDGTRTATLLHIDYLEKS